MTCKTPSETPGGMKCTCRNSPKGLPAVLYLLSAWRMHAITVQRACDWQSSTTNDTSEPTRALHRGLSLLSCLLTNQTDQELSLESANQSNVKYE